MYNLRQIWRFRSFETQPFGMPKIVLQDSSGGFKANDFRGTPLLKPTKTVGFFWTLAGLVTMACPCFWLVYFWPGRASRAQNVTTTNNSRSITVNMVLTWFCPNLGKKLIWINWFALRNLWTCIICQKKLERCAFKAIFGSWLVVEPTPLKNITARQIGSWNPK